MGTMTWPEVAHRLVQVGAGLHCAALPDTMLAGEGRAGSLQPLEYSCSGIHSVCLPPQVQRTHRLCAARDLTEHDIVARIMRRENYLIGMLNKVG